MASTNSLFYHRHLKGESLFSVTDVPTVQSMPRPAEPQNCSQPVTYQWDLQETCKPLSPAFDYISSQLAQESLSIHLIVSDQSPFVIPVWDLPLKSQITLCGIVRKACRIFNVAPRWMTALASLPEKDLPRIFGAYRADDYLVRRSMLQREVVYSSDGLTLLSIDHIFTLKQLLCTLSKKGWVAASRESCLASCVRLLHRIHSVYTGKPASAAYIERVYKDIPFHDDELEEVVTEYNARYCTASIYDLSFQPDYASIHFEGEDGSSASEAQELPDSSVPSTDRNTKVSDELVSPMDVELDMVRVWESVALSSPNPDYALASPVSVFYPSVQKPASSRTSNKSSHTYGTTPPSIPPFATASQIKFPPPASPPPSYPPPPTPPSSTAQQIPQHHLNHRSIPSTSSSLPISSLTSNNETDRQDDSINQQPLTIPSLPPSPLKIIKRASEPSPAPLSSSSPSPYYNFYSRTFPPPPNLRDSTVFPQLASSVFTSADDDDEEDYDYSKYEREDEHQSDKGMPGPASADDGEFLWELHVLESPRSYIESWSRGTEGALCRRCHEVV